jgi:hypothetical protein
MKRDGSTSEEDIFVYLKIVKQTLLKKAKADDSNKQDYISFSFSTSTSSSRSSHHKTTSAAAAHSKLFQVFKNLLRKKKQEKFERFKNIRLFNQRGRKTKKMKTKGKMIS